MGKQKRQAKTQSQKETFACFLSLDLDSNHDTA